MSVSSMNMRAGQFVKPSASFGNLDGEVTGALIAAAADIALVIDHDGVISDIALNGEGQVPAGITRDWLGAHWFDTVTVESRPKIEEMLANAAFEGIPRWRQVNHPMPGAADLPVRYVVRRAGPDGRLVAIGRELKTAAALQQRLVSAQQSMEREYARLRHAETRYRMLFRLTSEAVLVVDAGNRRIVECNPAAARLLSGGEDRLSGVDVTTLLDEAGGLALQSLFATVRSGGQAEDVRVRLAGSVTSGAGDRAPEFLVSASMFRQEGTTQFLVRLGSVGDAARLSERDREKATLVRVIEHLSDALVITDQDFRVRTANTAFLDLVQLATLDQVKGASLDRWIGRSGVDLSVLSAHLRDHGSVRSFSSILRGDFGSTEPVEMSAVSVRNGAGNYIGLSIRSTLMRSDALVTIADGDLPRSVEQLTELVGRVSLKELVREATDVIERLCIESALKLTRDNRASAAEMLGLSRQSLYSKMHRYGLGDLTQENG